MWLALIVIAQVSGASVPGGEDDLLLCTGKSKLAREDVMAACYRVTGKAVLDNKRIASAFHILGRFADNPTGAINNFDQAIALDPNVADYYGERGFHYHLLRDYDRALADYEKALALDADNSYTLLVRSFTLRNKGEYARAIADLDRAIAIDPKKAEFYTAKADTFVAQGDTAAALAALDKGIAINPNDPRLFSTKAEVLRKAGDADAELTALNRLIELDPKGQSGLLYRAVLYERLGKRDLAVADYDALIALAPGENFYRERREALLGQKGPATPAPAPAALPAEKAAKATPQLECRVYVPAANLTVSVPCTK